MVGKNLSSEENVRLVEKPFIEINHSTEEETHRYNAKRVEKHPGLIPRPNPLCMMPRAVSLILCGTCGASFM